MDKQTLQETVSQVLDEMRERPIPLGVSSRHIHLSTADQLEKTVIATRSIRC